MKIFYAWAILLVLIPCSVLAQNSDSPCTPSILVSEPAFQFDTVVSGQDVSHDYLIRNQGSATLKISRVKTATSLRKTASDVFAHRYGSIKSSCVIVRLQASP